jgi:pimeloyl-ACP methyl ester carboxylesterase
MRLQTKDTLMNGRWRSTIQCDNQVDPNVQNVIWQTIMAHDPIGSVWGPTHGVMRVRTSGGSWGWNREFAGKVQAPTLILVGKQDGLLPAAQALHADLAATDSKVLVEMDCATHFAVWEATQYKFMHQASLEWLNSTTYRGSSSGTFTVGRSDTSASIKP